MNDRSGNPAGQLLTPLWISGGLAALILAGLVTMAVEVVAYADLVEQAAGAHCGASTATGSTPLTCATYSTRRTAPRGIRLLPGWADAGRP